MRQTKNIISLRRFSKDITGMRIYGTYSVLPTQFAHYKQIIGLSSL